jgi:hypothetical protein
MPLTPFHLGPVLLFGYPLRRRMDLVTFLVASVLLDVRAALVFFGALPEPLHGPLHNTYLGALAVALAFAGGVLLVSRRVPAIAQRVSSRPESARPVVFASVAGTWSHVTLDAFVHSGMRPFYPLPGNPLYGLIDPFVVYGLCALAFVVFAGIVGVSVVQTLRKHGVAHYTSGKRVWKPSIAVGIVIGIVVGMVVAAGAAATIDAVLGIGSPDVTVERINDTHAAVTWTTEQPTRGYLEISVSSQCGPAWGSRTTIGTISDPSVAETHLVTAPIYNLSESQLNPPNVPDNGSVGWYRVEAVAVGESEIVTAPVVSRNLSRTCG